MCSYCDTSNFVGYDIESAINPKLNTAPNTNNMQCSLQTEYVDVKKYILP